MTELRKTGANEYDVVANGQVIGRVWNWHGSWSAKVGSETHHNLKSRKDAIAKVEPSTSR
jgi:hypothetical protein